MSSYIFKKASPEGLPGPVLFIVFVIFMLIDLLRPNE
jgi:hypothetical protein